MTKILPMHTPLISPNPSLSLLFSIIPEHPSYLDWAYSYFISLRHRSTQRLVYELTYKYKYFCPFIYLQLLKRELFLNFDIDILKFIKSELMNESYVHMWVNYKYILNSKLSDSHNMFIYGFDDEKKHLYVADHTLNNDGKYVYGICTYDELVEAFHKLESNVEASRNIETYKLRKMNYDNGKMLPLIKDQLTHYLNGSSYFNLDSVNAKYGINVYEVQEEILNSVINGTQLNIRDLYFLYEHKIVMQKRIEYLINKQYISLEAAYIIEEYNKITKTAEMLLKLSMKNNFEHDTQNIIKMVEYLHDMKETERLLLNKLILHLC